MTKRDAIEKICMFESVRVLFASHHQASFCSAPASASRRPCFQCYKDTLDIACEGPRSLLHTSHGWYRRVPMHSHTTRKTPVQDEHTSAMIMSTRASWLVRTQLGSFRSRRGVYVLVLSVLVCTENVYDHDGLLPLSICCSQPFGIISPLRGSAMRSVSDFRNIRRGRQSNAY